MKRILGTCGILALTLLATPAAAEFTYKPPGELVPGSGQGRVDSKIYVPNMRFPIEQAPAYANSQVWGHGGYKGPGGGQCDTENYSYPWWDNYCESRSWDVPLCPSGNGHQGQDIRAATCEDNKHWAVAAEAGTITNIGTYSVYLQADNGTRHRYLHMDPASIPVSEGQRVAKGDRLGRVSNAFGGTPTTIHLHYDLHQNVSGIGNTYVPTYMSLVDSYERLLGIPQEPCEALGPDGGTLDDAGPCFELHGPPASWRYVTDAGHDGDLHWTKAWDDPDASNWAQWHVETSEAGTYEVEVYVVADYAQAQQARYVVRHAGNETEERLDYTAGDGWRSLGEFDFAQGADQWVANYDNTGESLDLDRRIIADAVRLTRIRPAQPEPAPDVGGTPDVGQADVGSDVGAGADSGENGAGVDEREQSTRPTTTSSCSSTGESSPAGLMWLLVVLGFGWRRRLAGK
jgi:MYXO-CTERM domain-containing protein